MAAHKGLLGNQRGFALFQTFLLLVLLFTLGATSLFLSTLDLRSTTHYNTGNQALFSAESGLLHALSTMNRRGVQNFQQDILQHWSELYGSALKTTPGYSQFSYQVTLAAGTADPINTGVLTATGFAPMQAQRVLRVTLQRGPSPGARGALYLAADSLNSTDFNGNSFSIDGNDHTTVGAPNPAGPVVPGIATRTDGVTTAVVTSLNNQQKDNVIGEGFSNDPLTPSVKTTNGPSVPELDEIIANILSKPHVTSNQSNINGNQTWGTLAAPQITYLTASSVRLNGTAQGAGILIVDGSLTINGTFDFVGWIIVRGTTTINCSSDEGDITDESGSGFINGSLWTGDLRIRIGGNGGIQYCEACMNMVNGIGGGVGNLARPMQVRSWEEL